MPRLQAACLRSFVGFLVATIVFSLFSKVSISVLEHTQHPIQQVLMALALKIKQPAYKASAHPQFVPRLRMSDT